MKEQPFESVELFCRNLIDYAGLFPPAKLNLNEAFENFVNYKNGKYNWMLSNFICPVKKLPEITQLISEKFADERKIKISILGRGGHDVDDFKKNFFDDIAVWKEFLNYFPFRVFTNIFEIRFPDDLNLENDPKKISDFIDFISDYVGSNITHEVFIYLEGHQGKDWRKNNKAMIRGIEMHNLKKFDCGYKLRTGGMETYSFPPVEKVTLCIRECLDTQTRLKFTAGLHHPLRHYFDELKTMMHGFLNIFAAGIIAMRHNISDYGLNEILSDENPDNFVFQNDSFSWKDWNVSSEDIRLARENLVVSYGSCSFDEPIEDLKAIGLL